MKLHFYLLLKTVLLATLCQCSYPTYLSPNDDIELFCWNQSKYCFTKDQNSDCSAKTSPVSTYYSPSKNSLTTENPILRLDLDGFEVWVIENTDQFYLLDIIKGDLLVISNDSLQNLSAQKLAQRQFSFIMAQKKSDAKASDWNFIDLQDFCIESNNGMIRSNLLKSSVANQ